jgi:magnesium-transporting ATPase (P-type)
VNATGPNYEDPLSYTTGKAIFVIVLINAVIAAWTESKAGGAMDALSKMTQASIYVVRNGSEVKIDTPSIVRGDVVVLGTGDVVPADMRLISADDLKVSEMALTGEPDDVTKTSKVREVKAAEAEKLTPENMIFSGCSVTNGKGKGVVVDTGMGTRIGRIAQLISDKDGANQTKKCGCLPDTSANATPLQNKLESLGRRIGVLAIIVCIGVFVVGVALDRRDPTNPSSSAWLYMILIAVTLAVAAIPEGIPLCVTISLSLGCKAMVAKNVLVRKLAAVETLGSASVICSDKTGTLTEGKMTMVSLWAAGTGYNVSGKGFDPTV